MLIAWIRTLYLSIGDFSTRFALAKFLFYTLKTKLGVIPDFEVELEGTANTSLTYHGGEGFSRPWLSLLYPPCTRGSSRSHVND